MTNEDIVAALVAYYKRTGVDMTSLLGDPSFMSLKTVDKIEAIKKYAGELHDGSSSEMGSTEKKNIAVEAAVHAWPVIPATLALATSTIGQNLLPGVKKLTLTQTAAGGLVLGLGLGGVLAYAKVRQAQAHRDAIRRNLANVARDPSTMNAIGVLSTSNVRGQGYSLSNHLLSKIDSMGMLPNMGHWVEDNFKKNAPVANELALQRQQHQAGQN